MRVVLTGNSGSASEGELSKLLQLAAIDLNSERFCRRKQNNMTLFWRKIPESWEAMANKAICLFWLGDESLQHLPEVFALLEKSALLSNQHPKVAAIRKNLTYNLVSLASDEEMIGEGISWSLDIFEVCYKLTENDSASGAVIQDYIHICFRQIYVRLVDMLLRDGKDFDPPQTEVLTLGRLCQLSGSVEIARFFLLMADLKSNNGKQSEQLNRFRCLADDALLKSEIEVKPLEIIFPYFGKTEKSRKLRKFIN